MPETNGVTHKETSEASARETTRGGLFFTPRVDICETEDELVLECDMPGVKPSDLELHFERGELTIHGKVDPRQASEGHLLCEYGVGDFYRAFTISEKVDVDKISAELKHGVLTLHLPKKESMKPKRISVKTD